MSHNSVFGLGGLAADFPVRAWYPCQDNAANKVVTDRSPFLSNGTSIVNTDQYDSPGPTSWLPNAFAYPFGFNAQFTFGTNWIPGTSDFTVLFWGYWISTGSLFSKTQDFDDRLVIERIAAGDVRTTFAAGGGQNQISVPGVPTNTWRHVGFVRSGMAQRLNVSGTEATSILNPPGFNFTTTGNWFANFASNHAVSGVSLHEGALSAAQIAEVAAGPELVNSVAPVVTGVPTVGEFLSCTTGTWGLPSPFSGLANGTPVYSYQWRRNGSPISGATSNGYTLVAEDADQSVDCLVRATNSGGFDAAFDTSSNSFIIQDSVEHYHNFIGISSQAKHQIETTVGPKPLLTTIATPKIQITTEVDSVGVN